MKTLTLYRKVRVVGQSYKGEPNVTVPDQSMTLAEILERFRRRESLPVMREGIYEDRFGDLEKMRTRDPVEQQEFAATIKAGLKRAKDHHEKLARDQEEAARKASAPNSGIPEGGVRNGVASRDTGDGAGADRK